MSLNQVMRWTRRLTPIWMALCWMSVGSPAASAANADAHVVLITIDGFGAYLLNDPAAPIPTVRKLAAEGATAKGMIPIDPTVTWPNHTTLITGVRPSRHSVLFNGVLTRAANGTVSVDSARSEADLVAGPTIFEALHEAGMKTAAIDWPCLRDSTAVDDNFPDVANGFDFTTPRLKRELVEAGVVADETQKTFGALSAAARDQVWAQAACDVIRRRKPNFLALHLLVTDGIHHKHGPQTLAGYTGVALADANVAAVLRALDEAGIRDKTTVIVTADHGFAKADKLIQPNVVLREEGMLKVGSTAAPVAAKAQVISEGGTAMLYFTDRDLPAETRRHVVERLQKLEGVDAVFGPDQFSSFGLPTPTENPHMADYILAAKSGYGFSNAAAENDAVIAVDPTRHNVGYHGYLHDNAKMQAVFVAAGRGIRKGATTGLFPNINVAPTVARLLGVDLPNAEGKPLVDILAAAPEAADAKPANENWITLFDGKNLDEWAPTGTAVWKVEDGVIVGTQDGDPKKWGLLATKRELQDFVLELEFMIDEHGKYNSGVYIRNTPGSGGRSGYQVNIGRGAAEEYCAGLYTDHWLAKGDEKDTIRKVLQWNSMRILARGAHFEVDLNGVRVVDFTDPKPDPKALQRGTLALQTYGAEGHAGWVKFRNVRVRELPAER